MTEFWIETGPDALVAARELLAQNSVGGEKARLIVEYAEGQGGDTLAYWQLRLGPLFGKTKKCSMGWSAKELGLPLSSLIEINSRTWDFVREQERVRRP